jgi:GT2 family glycosyltransferase
VFRQTRWQQIEVIGIDNQSSEPAVQAVKDRWLANESRIRFVDFDQAFNFSAICNQGVVMAKGEYIVLLNNDVEITSNSWVESMLGFAQRAPIGAVGAMLHYPNQQIQHAGIVVGIGGSAGHPFKTFQSDHNGYFARLKITSNVSAVTGALLMVSRQKYLDVGGLDETNFGIALNDVDFCLKLQQAGYRNILTASCQGIHYESRSRGSDREPLNNVRYLNEIQAFENKWATFIEQGDPFYNPNLTLNSEDYTLR